MWVAGDKMFIIWGGFFTNKRYQFLKKTTLLTQTLSPKGEVGTTVFNGTVDSSTNDNNYKIVEWWFAVQPTYIDGFYFSPEYDGGFGWFTGDEFGLAKDVKYLTQYHNVRLCFEKVTKNIWIFDEFALRCGVMAQWNHEIRTYNKPNDLNTSNTVETFPWKSFFWGADVKNKQAKVTGGIGMKVGRGTLDISANFLTWGSTGFVTGPPAAIATLTADIGKSK
jgi:hypothetical protein